jgi:hypothetical protein
LRSTDPQGEIFEVVDLGSGGLGASAAGRRLDGKLALARGPAGAVALIGALEEHAAAGILLGAAQVGAPGRDALQLGPPAWYSGRRPFAFRLTEAQETRLAAALVSRGTLRVRARVHVTLPAAELPVVGAALRGSDLADQRVVLLADVSDEEPPSAVACAVQALACVARAIVDGAIAPLRRELQLVLVPGIRGTTAWLADAERVARPVRAALQLSLAPQAGAHVRLHEAPPWLPSFVPDLVAAQLATLAPDRPVVRAAHAVGSKILPCVDRDVALPAVWLVAGAPARPDELEHLAPLAAALAGALVELASAGPEDLPRLVSTAHAAGTARLARRAAQLGHCARAELLRAESGVRRRHLLWVVEQGLAEALRVEREALRSTAEYLDGPGAEALRLATVAGDLEQTAAALARSLSAELASTSPGRARVVARRRPLSPVERRADAVIVERLVVGPVPPLSQLGELEAADRRWLADNQAALEAQPGAEVLLAWADGRRSLRELCDRLALDHPDLDLRLVWRYLELLARAGLVALRTTSPVSALPGPVAER